MRTILLLVVATLVIAGCSPTRDARMWLRLAHSHGAEISEADTRGYLLAAMGMAHARLGDVPKARACAKQAVQAVITLDEDDSDRIRVITRAGLVHMRLGDEDEALRTVHQRIPATAMPWYWIDLAQTVADRRDWVWFDTLLIAAEQSESVIKSDAERQLLWAYLAFINQQHGRDKRSQYWMAKIEAQWLLPKVMADAAWLDSHQGRHERAQDRLQKAIEYLNALGPGDGYTGRIALTRVRILVGPREEAVELAETASSPMQRSNAHAFLAYRAAAEGDLDKFEEVRARAEEVIEAWNTENAGRRLNDRNIAIARWKLARAMWRQVGVNSGMKG